MSNDNKPIRKGDIIETKIESLAFGGKGIGRYDGLTLLLKELYRDRQFAARSQS